ncbi:hypothetical protein [Ruminococcus sp.]|uniref:hypothetical protein n=1 Tax=Ruminococcus sp. TaxID=41978 RepID=UPI0025CC341B|nr:hypothetical protein [Ruminococcus sp.]
MAGCRIVNDAVKTAVEELAGYSKEYKTAGEDFVRDFRAAIAEMEGASKDALLEFFDNQTAQLVTDSIPSAVEGMSQLLEANRSNFESVDLKIAESISSGK